MDKLIINPATAALLNRYIQDEPQGLLLIGDRGVGLGTIAKWMASKNQAGLLFPTDSKEQADEHGSIAIESIRQLSIDTRAKQSSRRVYVIDDADTMTAGAQAAFLKMLEEPNDSTRFILTSHSPNRFAKTILSRLQQVIIQPINDVQTVELLKNLDVTDQTKRVQLNYIAKGLPAELTRLNADTAYFSARAKIVTDARSLLQASTYDRLLLAQQYQSDRTKALQLVDGALAILRHTVRSKPEQSIIQQLEKLLELRENIAMNHNIKLQLARFVL